MAGANTTTSPAWSARQREVLDLIVRGRTNAEIAETLGISFATAKWHVSELIGKLGVSSREEVADYWRRERAPRRRFTRALRGLLAGPALKLAGGGAVAGVAATGVVWVAIAMNGAGGEPGLTATLSTTPTPTATVVPVPVIQQPAQPGRPPGCPTSSLATAEQTIFEGLLCHALNWPDIADVDAGNCDLRGLRLEGAAHLNRAHIDFRGCKLDGATLSDQFMGDGSFAGVSAVGTNFAFTAFNSSDMTGADLRGADLVRAQVQGANFTNAILLGADLTNAITRGARWSNTICPDGTNSDANGGTCVGTISVSDYWPVASDGGWVPPVCATPGQVFGAATLCAPGLYEGIVVDIDGRCHAPFDGFLTTDLRHADLRGCQLQGATLAGADFERASLVGANLEGADLGGAKLFIADLTGANLRGANLAGAVVSHTTLEGADLTGASTHGAMLRGTYKNTNCPDGTNSDTDDGDAFTCASNLLP